VLKQERDLGFERIKRRSRIEFLNERVKSEILEDSIVAGVLHHPRQCRFARSNSSTYFNPVRPFYFGVFATAAIGRHLGDGEGFDPSEVCGWGSVPMDFFSSSSTRFSNL